MVLAKNLVVAAATEKSVPTTKNVAAANVGHPLKSAVLIVVVPPKFVLTVVVATPIILAMELVVWAVKHV